MASKKIQTQQDWIRIYYEHLQDGSITAGKWIHLLYDIIINGLKEGLFFYDIEKANRAIRFMETFLHHCKGHLAPRLIKLEEWQKAMIACIFGVVTADGRRQFREVLCVVGRKCGKSLLASGIAEYMAYADGEPGADVYFLAPRLEQTEMVFNGFWQSVSKEPSLMSITKKRKSDIYIEKTNTSIKKIAFSQKKSDGFNPHLTICDEIAAWQGDAGIKQYEVMTSALGSRRQPLVVSITTANYAQDGIYDDLLKRATRFLLGDSKEQNLLPFLYIIDDIEKWNDIEELHKSLPNLGVSVSESFIIGEIAKAEGSLTNKREFLCKYCNIKQTSSQAWLSSTDVEACFGEALHLEDFSRCYAVGGIDLSQTTDLTACTCVIEKEGVLNCFAHFFLPTGKLEEATARDGVPYDIYVKKGWLTLSGDSFVDYHDCQAWFDELLTKYRIYPLQIGYDRYSSQYLVQEMKQAGYMMDDVYQGTNLTPVIRETEGLIKEHKLNFGDNDLLKIHLLNSALKLEEESSKCRLVKIQPILHIDGTAALLDALCVRQKWWSDIGHRLQNKDR